MPFITGDERSDKTATALRFIVEVDGSILAQFSECSGLDVTVAADSYQEGGDNGVTLKFPGRVDYSNLQLKRGIAESTDLFDWMMAVTRGEHVRKNVSVQVVTPDMTVIRTWQFKEAFPVKWTGPSLQSTGSSAVVEALDLAHEGLLT
jgi:phage tail-like protein